MSTLHCLNIFNKSISFCPVAELFQFWKPALWLWLAGLKSVDWPENKFDFIINLSRTSVSQTKVSLIEQQADLKSLFYSLHPPHISVFATLCIRTSFFSKNGFLYKSTVRDQVYLESENCCYQCWYTHAQNNQKRQIILFTKNRLLKITLGHEKQLLYSRRQALDSNSLSR